VHERGVLSAGARVGLGLLGVLAIVSAIVLISHGTTQTAARLARVAGILAIAGGVLLFVAIRGRL